MSAAGSEVDLDQRAKKVDSKVTLTKLSLGRSDTPTVRQGTGLAIASARTMRFCLLRV
jgi:hypothetical protein